MRANLPAGGASVHPVRRERFYWMSERRGRDYSMHFSLSRRARRQGRARGALAACGGLRSLTAARAVIRAMRAIPPESI
jgi:hypothetical protein